MSKVYPGTSIFSIFLADTRPDINIILGPSNGIDSTGVDVEELKKLMSAYESSEKEWCQYAFADTSRAYTRNLVDSGNGKANLVGFPLMLAGLATPKGV